MGDVSMIPSPPVDPESVLIPHHGCDETGG